MVDSPNHRVLQAVAVNTNVSPPPKSAEIFTVGSRSASPACRHASDDVGLAVLDGDAYIDPALPGHSFCAPDVVVDLSTAHSVVVALIAGADLDVFPAHVDDGDQDSVFVVDGNLGLRSWKAPRE